MVKSDNVLSNFSKAVYKSTLELGTSEIAGPIRRRKLVLRWFAADTDSQIAWAVDLISVVQTFRTLADTLHRQVV